MSGGPPHHPHGRQVPSANTAWNHLQVPNYFPRQPQHAHMSNEHSILHQPATWHTPTTETIKSIPHSNMFQHLLAPECFQRNAPGVDLSLTRNGSQNGEMPPTPISLSVRDTNKINSLPASVLDIQAVELTKCTSPSLKSISPGLKSVSPGLPLTTSIDNKVSQKRSNIRVDSILERLNPNIEKNTNLLEKPVEQSAPPSEKSSIIERIASFIEKSSTEKPQTQIQSQLQQTQPQPHSVIVQASSSHDENSNSSSILNVPTPTNFKEEDTVSTYSNEDSLDSNKSRRKRKPSKTVRVSKDDEKQDRDTPSPQRTEEGEVATKEQPKEDTLSFVSKILEENKIVERRRSSDDVETLIPAKTRRKTSSESETIDNIAAMVQECVKEKHNNVEKPKEEKKVEIVKPVSVSVIKTQNNVPEEPPLPLSARVVVTEAASPITTTPIVTPAQKKATITQFVEVENKLEEMFAGIEDSDPVKTENLPPDVDKLEDDPLLKLVDDKVEDPSPVIESEETSPVKKSEETESATVDGDLPIENGDDKLSISSSKKTKRKSRPMSRRNSEVSSTETTPKKKKTGKKGKKDVKPAKTTPKGKGKKINAKQNNSKIDIIKDVYAYDSGSNASSSKSRGPFIQIKGPRDSPISVNVVNTPVNEDDIEKKANKTKKYHDDSEYRHKVRSKGLHCSTLSNKYDAQTKDATWICAFCKRGPHATELTGPSSNGEVIPAGDLFGPYFITTECPEFEKRLDDPYDRQFKSRKISKVLDASASNLKPIKKGKRKHSEVNDEHSDIYLGITDTGNKTYEIWAHEDCIVWSPGIYLVGPKIVGLEEAIWTSCNIMCKVCNLKGANICCNKRGCLTSAHLCCARESSWQFDSDNFKVYCSLHQQAQ